MRRQLQTVIIALKQDKIKCNFYVIDLFVSVITRPVGSDVKFHEFFGVKYFMKYYVKYF